MAGISSHSNGAVQLYGQDAEKRGSHGAELFPKENNLPFHPALTECPSVPVLSGESFLQAKDLGLNPATSQLEFPTNARCSHRGVTDETKHNPA